MKAILFFVLFFCNTFVINAQSNNSSGHGKYVMYYKNGSVKAQGKYLNNKREGEWIYFHENGSIALKKNFYNGVQVGEWIYYNPDGTLAMKVNDISKINEKVEITLYDEKNKVKYKSTFVNGKNTGTNDRELNNKF